MNTSRVAQVGGFVILLGGLALAVYTSTNAPVLSDVKSKAVTKYISLSDKALASGDTKQANKFVKRALVTDPHSKIALDGFKRVALYGHDKSTQSNTPTQTATNTSTNTTAATATTASTTTTAKEKPVEPEAEAEDEMGCI
jgi:septal ring-binding cell division protein DamX